MTREQQAKALYDACPTPKQTWAQISTITRSVWLDRVPVDVPAGYTADELERDNPHNAWMKDVDV